MSDAQRRGLRDHLEGHMVGRRGRFRVELQPGSWVQGGREEKRPGLKKVFQSPACWFISANICHKPSCLFIMALSQKGALARYRGAERKGGERVRPRKGLSILCRLVLSSLQTSATTLPPAHLGSGQPALRPMVFIGHFKHHFVLA